ncbi:MAG: glycosyltransferase [Planctomycetota bacterium]|jgi:glycosyltransferase involved in cell wall biosynthesis
MATLDVTRIAPVSPPTGTPDVDAVVAFVYFDTPENERHVPTQEAFDCLMRTTSAQHHLVVVDNGSTDDRSRKILETMAEQYTTVDFIRIPENKGTAYGVNTGWYHRRHLIRAGAFPVKYDSDITINEDWLAESVCILRENPQLGLLGPRNPNQDYNAAGWQGPHHGNWFETTFVYGAVVVRSAKAWKTIGYMRNPYRLYAWDDHYDVFRARHADLRLGVLQYHTWFQISPKGCLPDDQKFLRQGQRACTRLCNEIKTGQRNLYEPFSGYVPDSQ